MTTAVIHTKRRKMDGIPFPREKEKHMKHRFKARCVSFFVACLIALLLSCAFAAFAFAGTSDHGCGPNQSWDPNTQQCVTAIM